MNRIIYSSDNSQAVPARSCSKDPPHHSQSAKKQRKYYAVLKDQDKFEMYLKIQFVPESKH